jgi:6-phosphogluconolactonase
MLLSVMATGCGGGSDSTGSGGTGSNPPGGGSTPTATSEILYTSGVGATGYSIDMNSGALTQISSNSAAPSSADIAVTANGKFLYVTNTPVSVEGYSIDTSGNLTAIPGSPFANPEANPFSLLGLAIDPGGKFLYTGDMSTGNIIGYTIDATSGALTAMPVVQMPVQTQPRQMVVSPSGKFLFVTDDLNGAVLSFAIDSTTGTLTPVTGSPFEIVAGDFGSEPIGLAIDPTGKFVYTALSSLNGNNVGAFIVDQTGGGLTAIPGSPFTLNSGAFSQTCCVIVHPSGKFVYTLDQLNSGEVFGYTINPTSGAPTLINGSPFQTPGLAALGGLSVEGPMVIDPSGKFMYIGIGGAYVSVFAIDSTTGALKPKGSPAAVASVATGMTIVAKQQ